MAKKTKSMRREKAKQDNREAAAAVSREKSRGVREIGELPDVENPARRLKAMTDFRFFCESYFPNRFYLESSPSQIEVMADISGVIQDGGLMALAMPRGSGKTMMCECGVLWGVFFGYHPMAALIGQSGEAAEEMIESVKAELQGNDKIAADFPDLSFPIIKLDGIANRAKGQIYHDAHTWIEWKRKIVVFPAVRPVGWKDHEIKSQFLRPDGYTLASGCCIRVTSVEGRLRGMKHTRVSDGFVLRPSLLVLDDPQTDTSARSPIEIEKRTTNITKGAMGMAGPDKKLAGLMPCTVIQPDDLAERFLDRKKNPEWRGKKFKFFYEFPNNMEMWEKYRKLRLKSMEDHGDISQATAFYKARRDQMDAGASVYWDQRFVKGEISAIQHGMNVLFKNEEMFWSEYQNEPLPDNVEKGNSLSVDEVTQKLNGFNRRAVPAAANTLTMYIDVQQDLLYYVIAAWEENFTGYVIDYGAYPDQKSTYFTLSEAKKTLMSVSKAQLEGAIYAGLEKLAGDALAKDWIRDDGAAIKLNRCVIDANWHQSTDVVYRFCRQSVHAAILLPSHGRYVGPSHKPMMEYRKKPGDRVGLNWRIPKTPGRHNVRYLLYDTNFWKSFLRTRFQTPTGDSGSLTLYGRNSTRHRMLADHVTAEYMIRTEGRGRTVDEWKLRPSRPDNHLLDCLVGCHVAAAVGGISLDENKTACRAPKKKVKLSDLQKERRGQ